MRTDGQHRLRTVMIAAGGAGISRAPSLTNPSIGHQRMSRHLLRRSRMALQRPPFVSSTAGKTDMTGENTKQLSTPSFPKLYKTSSISKGLACPTFIAKESYLKEDTALIVPRLNVPAIPPKTTGFTMCRVRQCTMRSLRVP